MAKTKERVTGLSAAVDILRERGGTAKVKDVTVEAAKRAKLKGKTPAATVAAQLYTAAAAGKLVRKGQERGTIELLPEAQTDGAGDEQQAERETDGDADEASLADAVHAQAAQASRDVTPHPKPTGRRSRKAVA